MAKVTTQKRAIDQSLARLTAALGKLEAAVLYQDEQNRSHRDDSELRGQLDSITNERDTLLQHLDEAGKQNRSLERTNREVSKRLVSAMERIRSVIQ